MKRGKKTLPVVVLAVALLVLPLAGCMDANTPMETQLVLTDPAELAAEKAAADTQSDTYGLVDLEYYYDFTALPDGAELGELKIANSVTRISYTFGPTSDDSYENKMELVWYRAAQGSSFISDIAANGDYRTLEGDGVQYLVRTIQAQSPEDVNKAIDFSQLVFWAQDSHAFLAAVPLSFTDEDILHYCVAKEIPVK